MSGDDGHSRKGDIGSGSGKRSGDANSDVSTPPQLPSRMVRTTGKDTIPARNETPTSVGRDAGRAAAHEDHRPRSEEPAKKSVVVLNRNGHYTGSDGYIAPTFTVGMGSVNDSDDSSDSSDGGDGGQWAPGMRGSTYSGGVSPHTTVATHEPPRIGKNTSFNFNQGGDRTPNAAANDTRRSGEHDSAARQRNLHVDARERESNGHSDGPPASPASREIAYPEDEDEVRPVPTEPAPRSASRGDSRNDGRSDGRRESEVRETRDTRGDGRNESRDASRTDLRDSGRSEPRDGRDTRGDGRDRYDNGRDAGRGDRDGGRGERDSGRRESRGNVSFADAQDDNREARVEGHPGSPRPGSPASAAQQAYYANGGRGNPVLVEPEGESEPEPRPLRNQRDSMQGSPDMNQESEDDDGRRHSHHKKKKRDSSMRRIQSEDYPIPLSTLPEQAPMILDASQLVTSHTLCRHGVALAAPPDAEHTIMPNYESTAHLDQLLLAMQRMSVQELAASSLVFNRELAELDFFWRVLYEAMDSQTPIMERVKFIAITASNLDGYVCKRSGNLLKMRKQEKAHTGEDNVVAQIDKVTECIQHMNNVMTDVLLNQILPELAQRPAPNNMRIVTMSDLNEEEMEQMQEYFRHEILPLLCPVAIDSRHPFPQNIGNLTMNVAAIVMPKQQTYSKFVLMRVPADCGRWIRVASDRLAQHVFVTTESLIIHMLPTLFQKHFIVAASAFRLTRDYFLEDSDPDSEDVLESVAGGTEGRAFKEVVRLEVAADIHRDILDVLLYYLDLEPISVVTVADEKVIGLADAMSLARLPIEGKYQPWTPLTHPSMQGIRGTDGTVTTVAAERFFDVIKQQDVYVQYPYVSFESSTQLFLDSASIDPSVKSIKMTWYRSAKNSLLLNALTKAVQNGKDVTVVIELKASFDEEKNIEYAQTLEAAGCTVAYGMEGMKTHAKLISVVRAEAEGLRSYVLIGTGNFNSITAALYIDMQVMSCRDELGEDVSALFNYLTAYCGRRRFRRILVSPLTMQSHFIKLINREAELARAGKYARIIARVNGLTDRATVEALYNASMAGVRIDLLVRGMCRVRPGIPGKSENIRVMCYVGRFLEHARVYYFHNDRQPRFYLGSADWMSRNLLCRVEVVTPVLDPDIQECIYNELEMYLKDDQVQAWDMMPDGRYCRRTKLDPRHANANGVWHNMMQSVMELNNQIKRTKLHKHKKDIK